MDASRNPPGDYFLTEKDLSDEELIDDRECIGNMKLVAQFQDQRSIEYKYLFPAQEYKLKKEEVLSLQIIMIQIEQIMLVPSKS